MHRSPGLAVFALCGLVAGGAVADSPSPETLHYHWRVKGLLRGLASLFFPSDGEGMLSLKRLADGHEVTELLLTSHGAGADDFFRYGAELDPATGITVRAWSSYRWNGETKSKAADIGQQGVIDIASGIVTLRHDPPVRPLPLEIWSDGAIYPVIVIPLEQTTRTIGEREIAVRHFSIQGVDRPNRRQWKGKIDLWLADDPAATPVEIYVDRRFVGVLLHLLPPAGEGSPGS